MPTENTLNLPREPLTTEEYEVLVGVLAAFGALLVIEAIDLDLASQEELATTCLAIEALRQKCAYHASLPSAPSSTPTTPEFTA